MEEDVPANVWMETPRNIRSNRPQRTPTPKLSERKKALFTSGNKSPINEELDVAPLDGTTIISPKGSSKYVIDKCLKKNSKTKYNRLSNDTTNLTNNDIRIRSNLFDDEEIFLNATSSTSTSRETSYSPKEQPNHSKNKEQNNKSEKKSLYKNTKSVSEELLLSDEEMKKTSEALGKIRKGGTLQKNSKRLCTDELRDLFKDTLNIQSSNASSSPKAKKNSPRPKRSQSNLMTESPKRKYPKLDENNKSAEKITGIKSVDEVRISTKSFYSNQVNRSPVTSVPKQRNYRFVNSIKKKSPTTQKTVVRKLFNKGVSHKIKRQNTQKHVKNNESIEKILKSIRSSKLKSLPSKRLEMEKIDELHKLFKTNQNPIEMARPLRLRNDQSLLNFSSSDEEDDDDSIQYEQTSTNIESSVAPDKPEEEQIVKPERKFFKSRDSTNRNEFKINNLRATMSNGKVKIIPDKKKKRRKIARHDESFSVEQAKVNDIIKNLDSSHDQSTIEQVDENLKEDDDYSTFLNRLPYQTNDLDIIERQHLLLEFLISYNICTEENFKIFITDPDNHKAEAAKIVDSLILVVPEEKTTTTISTENQMPMNNDLVYDSLETVGNDKDSLVINIIADGSQSSQLQINLPNDDEEANNKIYNSNETLNDISMEVDETITNSIIHIGGSNENISDNSKKLFPVFYSGKYQKIINKSTRPHRQRKTVWHGTGPDQYQIDAGQKEFGAKLCNKCGLVYTAHEAEEEQLHSNFHNSIQILKFKGWITEDVVDTYPSISGSSIRIIQVTEFSHIKQKERILDVLRIVDTELGFITNGLPPMFSAYLAVKKNEIVGFCLTHPLKVANRFVLVNGTECCTEDTFDVKCGLYRIWVSPLNRRLKIGTKLFRTVKTNAVLGGVNVDDIAFNAPTEDGQLFAQNVSNRTDFLVYQ